MNNPINYTDPSGLLTDQQIQEFTGWDIDDIDAEVYKLLLALHFGDDLWSFGDVHDNWQRLGYAELDESGHLQFRVGSGPYTVYDLMGMSENGIGFALIRSAGINGSGQELGLAYQSNSMDWWPQAPGVASEVHSTVTALGAFVRQDLQNSTMEWGVDFGVTTAVTACTGGNFLAGVVAALLTEMATSLAQRTLGNPSPGEEQGDRILNYEYAPVNGTTWKETIIIRGDRIIEHTWESQP